MHLTQLHPLFGIKITGIDLSSPLPVAEKTEFFNLLNQHKLVVFSNQTLSPEQQITACKQFGEIELHPADPVPWLHRELTYVANTDMNKQLVLEHCGPNFELWHSDTCYLTEPAHMSLLYAEQVPASAGETLFADTVQAYNDLPIEVKTYLDNKSAIFGSGHALMQRCQKKGYNLQIPEQEMEADVIHPVFRTHPYTKQKSIYVNWAHTDRILDITEEESEAYLTYLYNHCRQEKYVHSYHPQNGDLIVWDNASLIHSNTEKKLTDIRIMRRVMIKGTKPY